MEKKMATTDRQWIVEEDGCIHVGDSAISVTYHSALNSIIVSTREPSVKIYDASSGSLLQKSDLSGQSKETVRCMYVPSKDRILFTDGYVVGVRSDLRGMLLLDTVLQMAVSKVDDNVKIEIPLVEASHLLKSLKSLNSEADSLEHVDKVIKELETKIDITQESTKGNIKTTKWATVCVELPLSMLKNVCSGLVTEMKRLSMYNPGLYVASAVSDRLSYLSPTPHYSDSGNSPPERAMMYSEAARQETFKKWPHMNYKWALPDPMAQAGFYHQPNSIGDDRAMCFICNVCLVCWEPTDEPWSEHERHSPACPFVKGEYTQNVPLCVTYASQPAKRHGECYFEKIECISSPSSGEFIATSTLQGNIVVWNVGKILKKHCQFNIDVSATAIAMKTGLQIERSLPHGTKTGERSTAGAEGQHEGMDIGMETSDSPALPNGSDGVYEIPLHPKQDKTDSSASTRLRMSEDIKVKCLCVLHPNVPEKQNSQESRGAKSKTKGHHAPQPSIVCGVSLRRTDLTSMNTDIVDEEKTEVQIMNKVNEVVSGDEPPRIIHEEDEEEEKEDQEGREDEEEEEDYVSCHDELLKATSFVPYLLVIAVQDDSKKSARQKEKQKSSMDAVVSTPSLGFSPSLSKPMFTSSEDPLSLSDSDDDVQIVGVTPGYMNGTHVGTININNVEGLVDCTSGLGNSKESSSSLSFKSAKTQNFSEDGSTKTTFKVTAGSVLQCIELPAILQTDAFVISHTAPSVDGNHLVVVVSPSANSMDPMFSSKHKPVISNDSDAESFCSAATQPLSSCSHSKNVSNGGPQESMSDMDDTLVSSKLENKGSIYGCMLVYAFKHEGSYATLDEKPVVIKYIDCPDCVVKDILILPSDVCDYHEEEEELLRHAGHGEEKRVPNSVQSSSLDWYHGGQFAATLVSGSIKIFDICDFNCVAEICPPPDKLFVSATYCLGIERLCACTNTGELNFYQFSCNSLRPINSEPDQVDGIPSEAISDQESGFKMEAESTDSTEKTTGPELLIGQPLTVENVVTLHNVTQFENLMPRFTATVPTCWTEIQQEQQQRRHPQHLQHQGEATQHTRTWKLQQDNNTWDEHLFEIVLPRPCCVGHVDVKFSFHSSCPTPPDIQVTLLKQNISGIGKYSGNTYGGVEVDKGVNFGMGQGAQAGGSNGDVEMTDLSAGENNILDPVFQESHNAEILCGPLPLSSCLDLSGHSGLITLTSPQLMGCKPKSFLLHIKGFMQSQTNTGSSAEEKEPKKVFVESFAKKMAKTSSLHKVKYLKTAFDNDLFVPHHILKDHGTTVSRSKFADNLNGCDCIKELSVTIRKSKKSFITKERSQRSAMIEDSKFHHKLVAALSLSQGFEAGGLSPSQYQCLVLDILIWIAAIQMNDTNKNHKTHSLPSAVEENLDGLIKNCYIHGNRSTAHKCSRLLALCVDHYKMSADDTFGKKFAYSLLKSLLKNLENLPSANSAGAVQWYFAMINRVKLYSTKMVTQQCMEMLMEISKLYQERMSPLHSLLKARFGLYGQPFDADLFDTDLPLALKQTLPSAVSSYSQAVSGASASASSSSQSQVSMISDELDYYDLFNPPSEKSSKTQLEYARNNIFGLLEVEPLHFTCHSTSDGTKMERLDLATPAYFNTLGSSGLSSSINFGDTVPVQPTSMGTYSLTPWSTGLEPTGSAKKGVKSCLSSHIKQILSEMNKGMTQDLPTAKSVSDPLLPPTPKTTPMFMTPPLTPPNESYSQGQSAGEKMDKSIPMCRSSVDLSNTQTLLQQPPLQVLVIERMRSGARRFVILDFGKPIVLTDVIIPACVDLASLSIDVWVQGEEVDGQRFVVATDIGSRSLIMNDIYPPLVCRYLKITTVGSYGSGSTRSKIPIGAFYGHSCILPWEWSVYLEQRCPQQNNLHGQMELPTHSQLVAQLSVFLSLFEDIQCRYSLSKSRLETLLLGLNTQQYASSHVQYFLKKQYRNFDSDNKIVQAYQDCLQLQLQKNLAQRAIDRLHQALGLSVHHSDTSQTLCQRLKNACTDKLRHLQENLLSCLLSMTAVTPLLSVPPPALYKMLHPQTAEMLFKRLCIHGSKKIQLTLGSLLMRVCGSQTWWGNFLGNIMQEYFQSENTEIFSQDRVFVLLLAMGQKSLTGQSSSHIMESLLDVLAKVLSPLSIGGQNTENLRQQGGRIDLTLIGWILVFLCRTLDQSSWSGNGEEYKPAHQNGMPNRWNFIQGDFSAVSTKTKGKGLTKLSRVRKQTLLKKQEKHFKILTGKVDYLRNKIDSLKNELRAGLLQAHSSSTPDPDRDPSVEALVLPRDKSLRVVKGLMSLLLSMDFTCNVDLFLVASKVLATICTTIRPALRLSEAMSQEQLEKLLLLACNLEFNHDSISWGGPWAGHAITCLLQDILDGEKFFPATDSGEVPTEETPSLSSVGSSTTVTETDESLSTTANVSLTDDMETEQDNSDEMETTETEGKDKMNFDKQLMVDLLLNGNEEEIDSTAKALHEYVTAKKSELPPSSSYDSSNLNGTMEMTGLYPGSSAANYKFGSNCVFGSMSGSNEEPSGFGVVPISVSSGVNCAPGTSSSKYVGHVTVVQGMSTAMDARLEFGLETQSELKLKMMLSVQTESVHQAFSQPLPHPPPNTRIPHDQGTGSPEEEMTTESRSSEIPSAQMLSQCYEHLFSHMMPNQANLNALLQLWIILNGEHSTEPTTSHQGFDASQIPRVQLSPTAVTNLLRLINMTPSLPLCTWVLVFRMLSVVANQKVPGGDRSVEQTMAELMMQDRNLVLMVEKFLSGTSDMGPTSSYTQVGPSATKSFYDFLLRMMVKCTSHESMNLLKEKMLMLVYSLSSERGAFHFGIGPLDAQCKFLSFVLDLTYDNLDITMATSVVETISTLVHQHILCRDIVTCRSSSESTISARSCFGGLFASLLRGIDSSSNDANRDMLMCSLLRLVNTLVKIPCPSSNGSRTRHFFSMETGMESMASTSMNLSNPEAAGLLSGATNVHYILSDEEKSQQTDEQKTENLQEPGNSFFADVILNHRQVMYRLIESLSLCNSNYMATLLGSKGVTSHLQETFSGSEPVSVGDNIYLILCSLSSHSCDQKNVLESIFNYLSNSYITSTGGSLCRISEPLLWFLLRVLESPRSIHLFLDMGGVEIVCQNLVQCNIQIISTSPSLISTIMQNLNGKSRSCDKRAVMSEVFNPQEGFGLQDFAPLGTITSSSRKASPADALIQASQSHRRARSAAWSYHFYADESWVDLTIQLPFAILLKEVQIQPYNAVLTTCPSSVSLEISHGGVTTTPMCQPQTTNCLAFIKLQLLKPEVTSSVTIKLHKARDSMTIGLSQIHLLGYSAFGDTSGSFLPTEDNTAKSSTLWVRLLHHCLTAHRNMEHLVATAAASTPNLLNTCAALLLSPGVAMYSSYIESTLLKLGLHSVAMGLSLISNLLRSSHQQQHISPSGQPYLGKISGLANESTVEILYQLGIAQDSGSRQRIECLLQWLLECAQVGNYRDQDQPDPLGPVDNVGYNPAPVHIQCLASILWHCNDAPSDYNLAELISPELISALFEWSSKLKSGTILKKSIDHVLCSSCHINPGFFPLILSWLGIKVNSLGGLSASISDDRKDSNLHHESMTDDSKGRHGNTHQETADSATEMPAIFTQDFGLIQLEESKLSTLSLACKSSLAVQQLLDSGFPTVLAQGLFEFCSKVMNHFSDASTDGMTDITKSMNDKAHMSGALSSEAGVQRMVQRGVQRTWLSADIVASILEFFAEVSTEPAMKTWLGQAEGNIFWPVILKMLCNSQLQSATIHGSPQIELMTLEQRTSIEASAVNFFTHVTSCHINNQMLFARVLCDVIKEQTPSAKSGLGSGNFPLSGFTRCLFLQALLEDEKINVALEFEENVVNKLQLCHSSCPVDHPKYSGGRCRFSMIVSLHSTCGELLHKIHETPTSQLLEKAALDKPPDDIKKDFSGGTSELTDFPPLSYSSAIATGKAAKEKRDKEEKNMADKAALPPRPPTRRGRQPLDLNSQMFPSSLKLYHHLLPNKPLPGDLTLSQLLFILEQRDLHQGSSVLKFLVKTDNKKKETAPLSDFRCSPTQGWRDAEEESVIDESFLSVQPFPTSLQVFAGVGGLALLAEHLPLLYPEISRHSSQSTPGSSASGKSSSELSEFFDWVTVEPFPEDFYELYEPVSPAPQVSRANNPSVAMPTIPPHSLVAFGLFLRLPGYAEVLLKERKKAQCLLRLVLGVTDDGDGGHILTSPIASSLPTLPFLVLQSLYTNTPLTTDDGVLLRRKSLDIWVLHLILACLSVLSHHAPRVTLPPYQQEAQMMLSAMQTVSTPSAPPTTTQTSEEKGHQYWAKGTGFGTGSTTSNWDAEQALLRQKSEEFHVACLLQVLASFINPSGTVPENFHVSDYVPPSEKALLPSSIPDLFSQSCLVPAICSYLRNDSVLDMARHIPLYKALLKLLRGIAVCPFLVPLLLPLENSAENGSSIGSLLEKMKSCVDTYASRLKSNKGKSTQDTDPDENEGLAQLIPNIQETANIVKTATDRLLRSSAESDNGSMNSDEANSDRLASKDNLEERYMETMRPLQFDTHELVLEEESGMKFTVPYHYETNVKAAGDVCNPARMRRLAQESATLSTSLPLSTGSCVFVRCDSERLDIMKVLITGPADTPYENGCFEFDVYFPQDYPNSPPYINLETTGNHSIRFNPNLYNDGKVCLSVLNTWHGRPEEKWNPNTSSFLQVLVSIQSLILVSEPYFNEPGYERSRGTPSGTSSSREYDANIRQATVKWAMLEQLKNPSACFREIIVKHFWLKRHHILKQCEGWIAEMESYCSDKRTGRTIAQSTMALKRHYNQLREELSKLKLPEGLEEDCDQGIDPKGMQYSVESSASVATSPGTDMEVPGPSSAKEII